MHFLEFVYIPMLVCEYIECSRNEIGLHVWKAQLKKGEKNTSITLILHGHYKDREKASLWAENWKSGKFILHLLQHSVAKPVSEQLRLLLIPGKWTDFLRKTQVIEYCSLESSFDFKTGGWHFFIFHYLKCRCGITVKVTRVH